MGWSDMDASVPLDERESDCEFGEPAMLSYRGGRRCGGTGLDGGAGGGGVEWCEANGEPRKPGDDGSE